MSDQPSDGSGSSSDESLLQKAEDAILGSALSGHGSPRGYNSGLAGFNRSRLPDNS